MSEYYSMDIYKKGTNLQHDLARTTLSLFVLRTEDVGVADAMIEASAKPSPLLRLFT
jgi:hypothetical protein